MPRIAVDRIHGDQAPPGAIGVTSPQEDRHRSPEETQRLVEAALRPPQGGFQVQKDCAFDWIPTPLAEKRFGLEKGFLGFPKFRLHTAGVSETGPRPRLQIPDEAGPVGTRVQTG